MPKGFRRVHALTNTFSGVAGEARVAAEFVRCGLRVSKPYWTDDEVDLLVLERTHQLHARFAVPVIIQVKAVQFLPNKDQTIPTRVPVRRLKKRYITKSPAFGLAIYRVDTDEIFFIDGEARIRSVYDSQISWNKKHVSFDSLSAEDEVRISVHEQKGIKGDWKVDKNDARWLSDRIQRIVSQVDNESLLAQASIALWNDTPAMSGSAEGES
jgi:hypothetical protein